MKKFRRILCVCLFVALAIYPALAGTLVQFFTTFGEVDVELYDQDKPATVANFMHYLTNGYYTNNIFHRAVPGFVLQGGGYAEPNNLVTDRVDQFLSYYTVPPFPPITNEFKVGPKYSNVYGTIAMALTSASSNSATSEFFFNLVDNSANLDNQNGVGFVVFGHVLRGTNVLNYFNTLGPGTGYVNLGGVFANLPVDYIGNVYPTYSELVYTQIVPVSLQSRVLANNMVQLSWNSVNGVTNVVEYSTNAPGHWQTLVKTNGNGNTLSVTDSLTNRPARVYRVHVLF